MLTIVAGIDEVGYGPILGPLVVASSIFLVKEDPEANMWNRLQKSVGQIKKGLGDRLLVCDSKKAYSRQSGLGHLEQTVKAFLDQLHPLHTDKVSFSSMLPIISNDLISQIEKYPWYASLYSNFLPRINSIILDGLTENMKQEGIDFVDFRCICMDVAEFNKIVRSTGNKAAVVINSVLKLIRQILSIASFLNAKRIIIYCDRLGGRKFYGNAIRTLEYQEVTDIAESNKISKYKLNIDRKKLEIQFEVGADDKRLPVALASMVGKYVRERIMKAMNDYFIKLQPGLSPTAGYWVDGHRFLKDLEGETLEKASLRREDIVRIK